tara:strand:+ start:220 stop:399 length:180 start_codon:yes stop_codon:yes gene_type:complete
MTIERTVTPQLEWEIQVCDNALGAYSKYSSFKDEEMANLAFASFKVRLVQKSLIELGEK